MTITPNAPIRRLGYVWDTWGPETAYLTFSIIRDALGYPADAFDTPDTDVGEEDVLAFISASMDMDEDMRKRHPSDFLWAWIAPKMKKALEQGTENDLFYALYGKAPAMVMWRRRHPRVDVGRMSVEQMLKALGEMKNEGDEQGPPGRVVARLSDGWTAVSLPVESLSAEGEIMQNCLSPETYGENIERGLTEILSLRDRHGRPHVDVEYWPRARRMDVPLGKQNAPPIARYKSKVAELREILGARENYLTDEEESAASDAGAKYAVHLFRSYRDGNSDVPDEVPEKRLIRRAEKSAAQVLGDVGDYELLAPFGAVDLRSQYVDEFLGAFADEWEPRLEKLRDDQLEEQEEREYLERVRQLGRL